MSKLITQAQQQQLEESKQNNLELRKLSSDILCSQHLQNGKEKHDLQQTLNIAVKLLDQYATNFQQIHQRQHMQEAVMEPHR